MKQLKIYLSEEEHEALVHLLEHDEVKTPGSRILHDELGYGPVEAVEMMDQLADHVSIPYQED